MSYLKIYLTTYNRALYLEKAIESVLSQTHKDFELIILDNCSTDSTGEIIKKFKGDKRVSYYRQEYNIGGIGNINTGFQKAEGEYFCILHDDDICHPQLFEREIKYLEENIDCVAVSCLTDHIDAQGKLIRHHSKTNSHVLTFQGTEFFYSYLKNQKSMTFPPTMYRSSFIRANSIILKANPGPCCDVVLYMDIERAGGTLAELNEYLFSYRVYPDQDSSTNLEGMLISLMEYLKQDDYYGSLLNSSANGRELYYRWYVRRLLVRVASKMISVDEAKKYLIDMKRTLKGSDICFFIGKLFLSAEKLFPTLFNYGYKKAITRRRR